MRFPFLELPGEPLTPRPILPVLVEGLEGAPQRCLVDTGALHNLFACRVADRAGIPLNGALEERIAVGGIVTTGRTERVGLRLGDWRFEAPVSFCDPWPFDVNLLGQEGFLRYFRVVICAAEDWLDLELEANAA